MKKPAPTRGGGLVLANRAGLDGLLRRTNPFGSFLARNDQRTAPVA
jgi:hypothetical protein